MKLQAYIREVLNNKYSGGVKFVELVTDVTAAYYQKVFVDDPLVHPDIIPQDVETTIRNMEDVKILTYTWKPMPLYREKMFVYTP